tara:strand:- start:9323 stop:11428 length:2106 start_codon:yes stop_codon:yes gene_type:complete
MKFFEGWNRFLNESEDVDVYAKTKLQKPKGQEIETDEYDAPYEYDDSPEKSAETYFGKSPDNLPCVRDLRDQSKDVFPPDFYKCMEAAGYTKLGAGSFRATFDVPENPELVLKIVGPANSYPEQIRSREMNKEEAKASYQTASELIPKVYNSAKDYFWIISEKVTPIEDWKAMQEFFPIWKEEPLEEFQYWFQKLIDSRTIPKIAAERINKRAEYTVSYGDGEELVNDPLILNIRDLLAQFDLPAWDIRPHNVGYAVRNGQKQFVILDPGFELGKDVGTIKGQAVDPGRGISAIFDDDKKYVKTWSPEARKTTVVKENLNKNWQLFLENEENEENEENVKGPDDFFYDISKSPNKITINVLDMDKNPVDSKKKDTKSFISMEKRTDVPNWEVSWSSSPENSKEVGKTMYLMALELAEEGLAPDSYETSPDALKIWHIFMKNNEFGVEKQLKDGHEGQDESDPFNFVFFKPKSGILGQYQHQINEKEAKSDEKAGFDPEKEEKVEYFDPEQFNWEDLDDIDELYERLTRDNDTDMVSKVIIADDSGKILILKRSDKGNMWDLPGGHLKKGENPLDGAHRETKEETNLDISDLSALNTHENVHFFKCGAPKGDISLQPEEHTDFMWVNPKEIDQYDMKNHQKEAILGAFEPLEEQNEPYQRFSRGTYKKFITKLAKQGPNKYSIGGKMKKAAAKHLKSGPPGG